MQYKEQSADGLSKNFDVTIDLEPQIEARLKQYAPQVRVDGFRPGKAPLNLVRQRYASRVREEIMPAAIRDAIQDLLDKEKIRPAMQPQYSITANEDGKPLEMSVNVELTPEFEIKDFSKLKLEKLVVPVDQSKVDEGLKYFADQHAQVSEMKTTREIKSGDVVRIDFDGQVDGKRLPGMKAAGYDLEIGSGAFIPGFEDQLIGKKPGEDVVVEVKFPDNYHAAELAGKPSAFDVKIHTILKRDLPKIDDDLAKKAGFESLEQMKQRVQEFVRTEFVDLERMRLKRDLLDLLDGEYDFELPPRMVDMEFESIWRMHQNAVKSGQEHDDRPEPEIKDEYRAVAERRVRLGILLAELGRKEKIDVTQQEMNQALSNELRRHPGREQDVIDYYQNTPGAIEALRAPLMEEKVIDWIVEKINITEREVTIEELTEETDSPLEKKPAKAKAASAAKPKTAKSPAKKKPAAKKPVAKEQAAQKKAS